MAFIRIKKVKDWKYAYLVENNWKSKKTKQKVKQYLGRIYTLDNVVGLEFDKNIKKMSFKESVVDLMKFELMKNGFKEEKNLLKKETFTVDFEKYAFLNKKKPVVFESNEGFICAHTFNSLINFKPHDSEEETALRLAEQILGAGISIPHDVFVNLFGKIQKLDIPVIEDKQKFIKKI